MNIYLLSRPESVVTWDEVDSFVILAKSEDEARRIAADEAGDEGSYTWVNDKTSTCELIGEGPIRPKLVVSRSFNAG